MEQSEPRSPTGELREEQEEEEEVVSGEQRAQALRALLLARKRKHYTTEHSGMCGNSIIVALSYQMTPVNYSFIGKG